MSSDGLLKRAKTGRCRICQRVRSTIDKVKEVGEVRHGYATGHIWECIDADDCEKAANKYINDHPDRAKSEVIRFALKLGRAREFIYVT